jgi:ubiquinone/menaquinone biosynthesis C-methylase UbiE
MVGGHSPKKAEINKVGCKFVRGNIIELPFKSGTFDAVVGKAVLHHLSIIDVKKVVNETYMVLKKED